MATALKRIKSIQCPLNLNYLVQSSASGKKPCLGLRFHSDILNSKCRKIKKRFLFSPIVVNLLSSSILQVEQQKVTGFFPTVFMQLFVYWLYAVG